MKSMLAVMPVLPGKMDAWKQAINGFSDAPEFKSLAEGAGVSRVRFWTIKTPDGGDLAIVLHEGDSPENWLDTVMGDQTEVGEKFRAMAVDVHGFTPEAAENAPSPVEVADVTL